MLINLYLYKNDLQGKIPLTLGKCQNLFLLNLANNNLIGLIAPQVIRPSFSLVVLDLSGNQFIGVLPMEIGILKNLEFLNIF